MNTVWELNGKAASNVLESVQKIDLPSVLLQILLQRNVSTVEAIERFLYATLADEYDPFLLHDMDVAVARIHDAISRGEPMLVHGDYDVDGVTATALLGKVLERLGANYFLYLPERLKGGYGVSKKAVYHARERKAGLMITVDCGISAFEEVELARGFGIDVIITDHHQPANDAVPAASAVVNPWQKECRYPFKELSGVGIAYKLGRALLGGNELNEYLDLVAFGTVCDLSPLIDENRILVRYGLKKLDEGMNCGLAALRKVAGIRSKRSNTGHLGFMYGPRVNASGRLGSAECALRLLITDNKREAESLAKALDAENRERQKLEQIILNEAIRKVEAEVNFNKDRVIVVWNSAWHLGVIGIVAQRLVERYNLPAVVISIDKDSGLGRGSARSVKGFNIFEALTVTRNYLTEFGGHEYAAGIEIPINKVEHFRKRINEHARAKMGKAFFVKTFSVDAEISLEDISNELLRGLELLEPYGRGNPKPLFLTRALLCKERSIFLSKNTVKFWVTDGTYTYEAIWYKAPVDIKILKNDRLEVIYNLSQRKWHDRTVTVLEVKDVRILGDNKT